MRLLADSYTTEDRVSIELLTDQWRAHRRSFRAFGTVILFHTKLLGLRKPLQAASERIIAFSETKTDIEACLRCPAWIRTTATADFALQLAAESRMDDAGARRFR